MFKYYQKLLKKYLNSLNRLEKCLLLFMLWATVWPIVFPNWRTDGYNQLSEEDIEDDVSVCRQTSRLNTSETDCPLVAPNLVSYFDVLAEVDRHLMKSMAKQYDIRVGGRHAPRECRSGQRVAIIVPFRNRWSHLTLFVQHIHRFLRNQLIDYTIFIVEQNDTQPFNRGKLFNVGFVEANKLDDGFCCFIYHDIDVLPTNQKQLYYCSREPRHMCSALDKFRYVLIYPDLLGGVVAITKDQYRSVNGYSNRFEGWGGEDDDFYNRIKAKSLTLTRWPAHISRCIMLKHRAERPNPNRMHLLKVGRNRFDSDGLNDLHKSYQIIAIHFEPLYTLIKVNLKLS